MPSPSDNVQGPPGGSADQPAFSKNQRWLFWGVFVVVLMGAIPTSEAIARQIFDGSNGFEQTVAALAGGAIGGIVIGAFMRWRFGRKWGERLRSIGGEITGSS